MSEVDISDDLTNGDDSAFVDDNAESESGHSVTGQNLGHNAASRVRAALSSSICGDTVPVFVTTSQGILTQEQLNETGLKTAHIVIQDQSLLDTGNLKSTSLCLTPGTPVTPIGKEYQWENIVPPTPATPRSKEKGFKYQWDNSVYDDILPVRCKRTNGLLFKSRFGSGGRGKCIKVNDEFFTPNKFEALSGRSSSKDWKRSIRYGGRTLHCLIEDNILHPHATSCTCAACCDDDSVVSYTGPVKLFVPYKRRKVEEMPAAKKVRDTSNVVLSPNPDMLKETASSVAIPVSSSLATLSRPITVATAENGETVHIVTTDGAGNIISGDAVVMTAIPQTTQRTISVSNGFDVNEQKQWWQMEEMANNLIQQAQHLQLCIQQCKQQSLANRESLIQQMSIEAEKEKIEAVNAARMEAQITLSRAIFEERAQKDGAVQQTMTGGRTEAVTLVADDKVNFVSWTTSADAENQ